MTGESTQEDLEDNLGDDDFDDGSRVSAKELLQHIDEVDVCADRLADVLCLEVELIEMLQKLPSFCLCLMCFVLALSEFSPSHSIYNVHRRLQTHFELDRLPDIRNFAGIYNFMEDFEHHNEEMQATSYKYWCEGNFSIHRWDENLMIPVHSCPSPRLYALGLVSNPAYAWNPNGFNPSAFSGGSGSASGSGDASTRLLAGSGSSSSGSGGLNPAPACRDDDHHLTTLFSDANASCPAYAVDPSHLVCEHDTGILHCPLTCGFCGPFEYHHLKRFERPQVTMLPIMVFQTRFVKSDCHGFAVTYETQPYNPVLTLLPALDGPRNDDVLTCIDRKSRQESDYAIELDCTPDTPALLCVDGKVRITQKHTYHGDVIYPKLLIEPQVDIGRMRAVEWVDLQTDVVSLSTVVYTEGVEIFTSCTVSFTMDEAGNVDGSYQLISYRDLVGSSRSLFLGCLSTCIVFSFFGVVCSSYYLIRYPRRPHRGSALYELFSRALLFLYPLILLIQWSAQIPMSEEFDHLLHSFLDMPGISEQELEDSVQKYFDTKTIIYEETSWLSRHRIAAYFVCYVQILQLVFLCNAHPKMAVLTATIHRAMDHIGHFLALFGILYVVLALLGHWMLGPYIASFGTIGTTLASQVQMMFGEFIKADGVDTLDGSMAAIYWIFASTFMLLVIWTLMNFFLAIIVDSFVEVKEANAKNIAARGFVTDVFSVVYGMIVSTMKRWPPRSVVLDFCHKHMENLGDDGKTFMTELISHYAETIEVKQTFITHKDIERDFREFDTLGLAEFMLHYYYRCPAVLAPRDRTLKPGTAKQSRWKLKMSVVRTKTGSSVVMGPQDTLATAPSNRMRDLPTVQASTPSSEEVRVLV